MNFTILDPSSLAADLNELDFSSDASETLLQTAWTIASSKELASCFERSYKSYILSGEWKKTWDNPKPEIIVQGAFGEKSSLFYLLCYMEELKNTKKIYREKGIPRDVYLATLTDISVWLEHWRMLYGYYRFDNLGWIWRHLCGQLFRLGRLQFMLTSYYDDVLGFQDKNTGLYVLLCKSGLPVNACGDYTGAGGRKDDKTLFVTEYEETASYYTGCFVTPYGKIGRRTLLPKDKWNCVLRDGDPVLELHIPRGRNLLKEDCACAVADAEEFFARYFGGNSYRALCCHTWMFTPQLQQMLPKQSNIVGFQREFYLHPNPGSYRFMWNFVFDEKAGKEKAPEDTLLRRKAAEYVREKKTIFDLKGVCFHDSKEWGRQKYMNAFDEGAYQKLEQEG